VKQRERKKSSGTSRPSSAYSSSTGIAEESSAHAAEVKKYQKRIADLETRIQDLTIMGAMVRSLCVLLSGKLSMLGKVGVGDSLLQILEVLKKWVKVTIKKNLTEFWRR